MLDVDDRHGGTATLDALHRAGHTFAPTLTVRTGGGGAHYYFAISTLPIGGDARVPNTSGRIPAVGATPGLDIRGDGGYVVAPPSLHRSGERYEWTAEPGLATLPDWLRRPPRYQPSHVNVRAYSGGEADRYASTVLRREAQAVAGSIEGQRSDQLNRSAFALGTLVGAGMLSESDVEEALLDAAAHAGLGHIEASRTITSGLRAGMAKPRLRQPS